MEGLLGEIRRCPHRRRPRGSRRRAVRGKGVRALEGPPAAATHAPLPTATPAHAHSSPACPVPSCAALSCCHPGPGPDLVGWPPWQPRTPRGGRRDTRRKSLVRAFPCKPPGGDVGTGQQRGCPAWPGRRWGHKGRTCGSVTRPGGLLAISLSVGASIFQDTLVPRA